MTENKFKDIESKWQKVWAEKKAFQALNHSDKKKFYCLEMFPYPSSTGLHVGHALNYTIGDIFARFKRMNGFNVLYPMGFDAFGLPAENAAIKAGEHPAIYTEESMKNFTEQQKALGLSYDWDRTLATCRPDYYKWNQFFFIKLYEQGLVYRKKSAVNWCPDCKTVLANEQVQNGKCWRHEETDVEIKQLEQWYIKTTKYADELLEEAKKLDWPERIKVMQENWIGKSEGTEIHFAIETEHKKITSWPVFTTRIDTVFGVTFLVVSAQHSKLHDFVSSSQKAEVDAFVKKIKSVSEKDQENLEKEGVFTGSYAINPFTNEKVPIWAGNFVLAEYGSGMVMAVPAHDQRDFEFAKKYDLKIKQVIRSESEEATDSKATKGYGILFDSGNFNGLTSEEAIPKMQHWLNEKGIGKKVYNYKFRDWLVSRQRYWGTPIPFIYCSDCGPVPEKLEHLPIKLPTDVKFGEGNPIATSHSFVNTKCPKCGKDAKRETDTMDTFFDSSWYFLRYLDNHNEHAPFDKSKVDYWMSVDLYIGGAEHACLHLLYARFFVKALRDMKMLSCNEPFLKLFNQGTLYGADGNKMSKSKGNAVSLFDAIGKYSADSLRFFLMSLASQDSDVAWTDTGMDSAFRFVSKMYTALSNKHLTVSSKRVKNKINKCILEVTYDIENFKYNLAIVKLRDTFDYIEHEEVGQHELEQFIKLLHPICPHMTEELWYKLGHQELISLAKWPEADESAIDERIDAADLIVKTTMLDIHAVKNLLKITMINKITLIISPNWKYDLYALIQAELQRTRNGGEILKTIMGSELKKYGQEITKIVPSIVKDPSKIPELILNQQEELLALHDAKEKISETFDADVVIVLAEESQDAKAKNASPGKPAIVLS